MSYAEQYRGMTPGHVVQELDTQAEDLHDDQLVEMPAEEEMDDVTALAYLAETAQQVSYAQQQLAEIVAQQDSDLSAVSSSISAGRENVNETLTCLMTQVEHMSHEQRSMFVSRVLGEVSNNSSDSPVAPIPQTHIDDTTTLQAMGGIHEGTMRLDNVQQRTATADGNLLDSIRTLIGVRDESALEDLALLGIISLMFVKFLPRVHVHIHSHRGVAASRPIATAAVNAALSAGGLGQSSLVSSAPIATSATTAAAATVAGTATGPGATGMTSSAGTLAVAGSETAAGVTAFTAASVALAAAAAGAAALVAAHYFVPGFACTPSLEQGAEHGSCSAEEADVLVISEEGIGKCKSYYYRRQQDSARHAGSWWYTSRIEFTGVRTGRLEERRRWGPAMPYNTIREAARMWEPPSSR